MRTEYPLFDTFGNAAPALVQSVVASPGASVRNRNKVKRDIKPRLSGQRLRVLEFVKTRGIEGATRHEIAEGLGIPLQSVCGRVAELLDKRWPELLETDAKRETQFKQPAVVLVAITEAETKEPNE